MGHVNGNRTEVQVGENLAAQRLTRQARKEKRGKKKKENHYKKEDGKRRSAYVALGGDRNTP